jgi:hypothetical protein
MGDMKGTKNMTKLDKKIDACVSLIRLCDRAVIHQERKLERFKGKFPNPELAKNPVTDEAQHSLVEWAETDLAFARECLKKAEWLLENVR